MDAVTQVPVPANEPVLDYAPGSPERASWRSRWPSSAADPHRPAPHHRRQACDGRRQEDRRAPAARSAQGPRARMRNATVGDAQAAVDAAKAAAPGWRELSFDDRAAILLKAAELLSGPWRARLNAATMLGQSKTRLPGRDRRGLRADRLLAHQRALRPADPRGAAAAQREGHLEPHRPPAARGLRLRHHALQLHRDRRQPADRSGADGQHRRVEAVPDPAVRRPGDHGAARGRGPAGGRDQPGHRRRPQRLQGRPRRCRPRRHPLHRLHADLPAPVAGGRRQPAELPQLPAPRRRDRRQGLHPRPPSAPTPTSCAPP